MTSKNAKLAQLRGNVWPEVLERQCLCGQLDKPCTPVLFPAPVRTQLDTQLLSCPFLRPAHTLTPQSQLETAHIPEPRHMKIFRNRPGEILTQYENFALCALYGGGTYGH
jgi:hypothetical protein